MPRPLLLSPEERAEEATFRRLCRVLGMHGTSERCKKRRRNAFVPLKSLGGERQQALFTRVWEQE